MKYTVSIEISLPREKVAQLLADPAHLPKWLRGLVLHEPLNGEHGQVGTKSRVVMQMGQQTFEGTETITRREPVDLHGIPRESVVYFEREIVGMGMWNAARERLTEAGPETTLWESENEYRFNGLMMRLVGLLMPGAFRKQSLQHMQDFKAFAEHGKPVDVLYQYVAWFHNETLPVDDQDYEWPGVILIRAADQESALAWGDELAKTCADTFVRSTAEPLTESIQSTDVVVSVGQRVTAQEIGW